jgi:hypothetical protein
MKRKGNLEENKKNLEKMKIRKMKFHKKLTRKHNAN